MTNIKLHFTEKEYIKNEKFDLILKSSYDQYERLYSVTYENKKILIYAFWIWFFYTENNWFLYLTNWKDILFEIKIEDFSVKTYESTTFIVDIFFYKNFTIIYDELSIDILDENLNLIKSFTSEPISMIKNCFLEWNKIIFYDENDKKYEKFIL